MLSEVSFFGMLFYGKLQSYSRAQKQNNKILVNVTLCTLVRIRKMKHLSLIISIFNNNNEAKILGINFENKLTFKRHVKTLRKKAVQKIGALSRLLN